MSFLSEALSVAGGLVKGYGLLLVGMVGVLVSFGALWFVAVWFWKGLVWLGIPSLAAKVWAKASAAVVATTRWLLLQTKRLLKAAVPIALRILWYLVLGLGLWVMFYLIAWDRLANLPAYAGGAVILSLLLCLIGWPLASYFLLKRRLGWRELPLVIGVSVCWIAPFLAIFPFMADG